MLRVGFQMDPLENIDPLSDTSFRLAEEAQNRGYTVFHYLPDELTYSRNKIFAKGNFVKLNRNDKPPFSILENKTVDIMNDLDVLWLRQDPPFNLEYITTSYILEIIKDKVKIINNPTSIRNISEKLFSSKYQKFMPPTIFTQNLDEIKKFIKTHKKIILKPIHGYGGNDIRLLSKLNINLIKKFIKKHNYIMCQKFLPKINKGDKRVFIINGKIVGAISRIPKKGSYLSNLSKGGKAINIALTSTEKKISKILAKDLKKENIFISGIDFIDQKLNGDINVTSPTGLKTLYDLSNKNLAKTFWKELKA